MKRVLIMIAAAALVGAASAQESSIVIDEEALFGEESEDIVEAVQQSEKDAAVTTFLKTDTVRIGGSFSGSVGADWTMYEPWTQPELDDYGLTVTAAGSLFFDARPSEDFRVYGKAKTSYPFTDSSGAPNLQIFELFADWNYKDSLFLRFGKHTVKWGVGYFFSPADVINIGAIDPLDPEAQREGPVSLRLHYPVLGTQTNLWAYAIMPQDEDPKPEDIAGAAKIEFLVAESWEIGIGGYYKYEHPPRAVLTASGSIWKFNVFGEAVGAWGSDKDFVTDISGTAPFYSTEERRDQLFFSGTAGFMYTNSDSNWTIVGQYYYNGEGYADEEREDLIDDAHEIIDTYSLPSSISSPLLKGLIYNSGRHYAALSVSKSELFCEDFSVGALVWANLSDFSGWARPYLSYEFFDKTSLELSATFAFGSSDSEYVVLNDGPALSLGFKLSLGSGNF